MTIALHIRLLEQIYFPILNKGESHRLQTALIKPNVSWLPLFYDMGLIGAVLQSLYMGAPCVVMPPAAFLQNPIRWLQAVSRS